MITFKGTIRGLSGLPMSGLWDLVFEDGRIVHIESGYGVSSLASCFGATGDDLQEKISGQEIVYTIDDMNILYGFTPTEEWEGIEIPEEGIEEEVR